MKINSWSPLSRSSLLAVLVTLAVAPAISQQQERVIERPFEIQPDRYLAKWDSVHKVLAFFRDTDDFNTPAARAYDQGTDARPAISPLRDFPDAKGVDVWDVSGAANNGVLLASAIQYGGQRVKLALLTYDRLGSLQKFWEVYPYHHHRVAVDHEGNVYAFGHREDRGEDAGEGDYALLIKYAPSGKVLWEALPRSTFPYGRDIVTTNQLTGEHSLLVAGRSLVLYVATTKELVWLDLGGGKLLRRVSVSSLLSQMAADNGMSEAQLSALSVTPAATLHGQVRLWRTRDERTAMGFAMFRIAPDGSSCQRVTAVLPLPHPGIFLGSLSEHTAVFLGRRPEGDPVLIEQRIQ